MALTVKQKRCQDCACLIKKNGKWACDECFGQLVEDIDDCPEGFTLEELEELETKAKENKVKVVGKAEMGEDKPKKVRTYKPSTEKEELFDEIWSNIEDVFRENAQITKKNKEIMVKINEKWFKIDISEKNLALAEKKANKKA